MLRRDHLPIFPMPRHRPTLSMLRGTTKHEEIIEFQVKKGFMLQISSGRAGWTYLAGNILYLVASESYLIENR